MRDEIDCMARNKVQKLVDLPLGRKSIENKCVFKIKYWADRSIDKFKVCLVVKGFTQIEGVDYEETFSPVVRIASIHLLLALVAHLDLELFKMDIKIAFLNGNIEEEIYMDQLIGFISKGQEDKICHLKGSIYGLKQSSRAWCFRFYEAIISLGLNMVSEDHCMYIMKTTKRIMFLTLYLDDILQAGNNMEMIQPVMPSNSTCFTVYVLLNKSLNCNMMNPMIGALPPSKRTRLET